MKLKILAFRRFLFCYNYRQLYDESFSNNIVSTDLKVGRTALHWAACLGRSECVKALLAMGADKSIKNKASLSS
jgi:ankyrin repeat protein